MNRKLVAGSTQASQPGTTRGRSSAGQTTGEASRRKMLGNTAQIPWRVRCPLRPVTELGHTRRYNDEKHHPRPRGGHDRLLLSNTASADNRGSHGGHGTSHYRSGY